MPYPGNQITFAAPTASPARYTAPADGWFCARIQSATSDMGLMVASDAGTENGATGLPCGDVYGIIPVRKNEPVAIWYTQGGGTMRVSFIYAIGSGTSITDSGDTSGDASGGTGQ